LSMNTSASPFGNISRRVVSDEARRIADIVNTHYAALGRGAIGKWVASRLSDGTSDGVLYDTREDAIRHQLHETQCVYVCIPPGGAIDYEIERFLQLNRQLYDNGYRLIDPSAFTNSTLRKFT
jgi:hypothetical protein